MSYVTPKKNVAYKLDIGLVDQANTKLLKVNPTIAVGDFKVSTDHSAFANLATLPSVNPAGGRAVMIDLSAAEMNGDNIIVQCVDAAGAEWCDLLINIQTTISQVDDLATAAAIVTVQADTDDIQTRLPVALVGGRMDANASAIAGSATAATDLQSGALGLVPGTCAAGSTTTSIVTNLTEATDSHYNGRVITFTGGALLGQTSDITAYNGTTKTLTVTALTEAPANTDPFVIS